ncbi:hypothetical protein QE397_002556 [Rhodococcus sp. SORGH_AS 301]|nr:hypothetical protein [Rhodococcus sp. SORGH_AS_0301]
MDDAVALVDDDLVGLFARIASGEHRHLVAAGDEGDGEASDMDVLPPGVDTARRGERAGMF